MNIAYFIRSELLDVRMGASEVPEGTKSKAQAPNPSVGFAVP